MKLDNYSTEDLFYMIKECQKKDHKHQVAFSTYENALTQVCFNCDTVRTSMRDLNIKEKISCTNCGQYPCASLVECED